MSDPLLPFYNSELSYLRRLGAEFAEAHPKIAARLRLGSDVSQDPHVERLVQAFAYLTARIRFKLEDDFPELSDTLLGILYPHYHLPIPALTTVQLGLDPEQAELTTGHRIERGTLLETEPIDGEPCRFRTCYPVTLWPIEIARARLSRPPFQAPTTPKSNQAASVLCLSLRCLSSSVSFASLDLDCLRFFLKGQNQHVYPLYELLLNNVLEVALATGASDAHPVVLPPTCLRPVGFGLDEGLLPYSARSFLGYRLLTEFFAFPEKFLYVDLADLTSARRTRLGRDMDVYLYLKTALPNLETNVAADMFRLGCTPLINLYRQRAEPIRLTHTSTEYALVPDARRPLAHEVYTIDRVTAISPEGNAVEFAPFYSVKHTDEHSAAGQYWHGQRRASHGGGTDMYLSLVDLSFTTLAPAGWTLDVETTCLNRDLPRRLPFGGDQPRLQFSEGEALVSSITCLSAPTSTLRMAQRQGALWRLISHLSLNHLSLIGEAEGALALREILKLYDFADSEETRAMIEGVLRVKTSRSVGRSPQGDAVCRGTDIELTLDEKRFAGSGLFLFAEVLERFLGLYCSINSFTRLSVFVDGRKGALRRWPPRMGEKVLI
jgi:type VI secretion system protein ImpG